MRQLTHDQNGYIESQCILAADTEICQLISLLPAKNKGRCIALIYARSLLFIEPRSASFPEILV